MELKISKYLQVGRALQCHLVVFPFQSSNIATVYSKRSESCSEKSPRIKVSLLQEAADGLITTNIGEVVKKPLNIFTERKRCPCLIFQHRTGIMSKTIAWKHSHISSWLHAEPWCVSSKESARHVMGAQGSNHDSENPFSFSKAGPPSELCLVSFICQAQRTLAIPWLLGEWHDVVRAKYLAHSTRHTASLSQINSVSDAYGVASNLPGTKRTRQECDCYSLGHCFHYPRRQILPARNIAWRVLAHKERGHWWQCRCRTEMQLHTDLPGEEESFTIPRPTAQPDLRLLSTALRMTRSARIVQAACNRDTGQTKLGSFHGVFLCSLQCRNIISSGLAPK